MSPISEKEPMTTFSLPAPWTERKIILLVIGEEGDVPVEVFAWTKGSLAIHPDRKHPTKWAVSSRSTSLRITVLTSLEDAYKCAEDLLKYCRAALEKPSKKEILPLLAPWTQLWLKRCHDTGVYCSPQEFITRK